MIISYNKNRYSVQEIKSCATSNGVKIYFFKNLVALANHLYIVAVRSCAETLEFHFVPSLSKACEMYLEFICKYA